MFKFFASIFANAALISAESAAGLASMWNAYQPKEPESLRK